MKNIKVRTKLTIILALVIVLVTSESFISIKNMNQLKDKALETMDTSSRQNYDDFNTSYIILITLVKIAFYL